MSVSRYVSAAQTARIPVHEALAHTLAGKSRVLGRALASDPALLDEISRDPFFQSPKPPQTYLDEAHALDIGDGGPLRRWRRRELIRIVLREAHDRDLRTTLIELSDLASAAIEAALQAVERTMTESHGPRPCGFCVMGMGKLGGRELNLSSDVDLIYLYEADIDGSTHGWFRRFSERVTRLLSEITAAGFVYRVDLNLRPEGRTGPICNSLAACERYYEAWGHAWERVAWLRARPVAGDLALGETLLRSLEPFVYRRHLDLGALEEIADMKAQIDEKAAHTSEFDIKLGAGGIREVEFLAQTLQLVHGWRRPALRTRDTLEALERLVLSGLISQLEQSELADAYLFLRAVENQIQLVEERQTHLLPEPGEALDFIASALGYDSADALVVDLAAHRGRVSMRWALLFGHREKESQPAPMPPALAASPHLAALEQSPKSPLHPRRRFRHKQVARVLLEELPRTGDPEQAMIQLRDLIRALPRASGLWDFMDAHPVRLRALLHLLGASRLLGGIVARNPALLDGVVLGGGGSPRPAPDVLKRAFANRQGDTEQQLAQLRSLHQGEVLRIGFYDVAGELSGDEVSVQLTTLAEVTLDAVLELSIAEVEVRYGRPDGRLAVVAFGRLGAREMAYGSDLDLLFLYEGQMGAWARVCHRLINGLSLSMAAGRLYEVDTRMRPSGNQGALLVTPDGLARHYRERSQVWEQQAVLKARYVAGDAELGACIDTVRAEVLSAERDPAQTRLEVERIRARVQQERARENTTHVDLKYGHGGLLELDLALQTLWLLDGGRSLPQEPLNTGSALQALEMIGVLQEPVAQQLREAYHVLRKLESRMRIAYGRPNSRISLVGPTAELLARRMGFHDLPGRTAAHALIDAYRRHVGVIHAIYERTIEG